MEPSHLITEISRLDFDLDKFVDLALHDTSIRNEIVQQLIHNPYIMVYYHCYYVLCKAIPASPDLFKDYWNDFALLLEYKNSYHRDFGLTFIAHLTAVDTGNLFRDLFPVYFKHLNDPKFLTAHCCIQNSKFIISHKADLLEPIVEMLLDIDHHCDYPAKQKALLKYDVLEILDQVYEKTKDKDKIVQFMRAEIDSISPKTRKKAREMVKKYGR